MGEPEITLKTEQKGEIIRLLQGLGFDFTQELMKKSISYYDFLIHFHDGLKYTDTLIVSNSFLQFCEYK